MSNIALTKEEALQNIKDLQEYIEQLENESEIGWKPKAGEKYYYVVGNGDICEWTCEKRPYDNDLAEMNNCFRTEEEAEWYRMRLMSMKKTYLPKKGDEYWLCWEGVAIDDTWNNDISDWHFFHIGQVFRTESECKEWINKYAKYWTGYSGNETKNKYTYTVSAFNSSGETI